MSYHEEQERRIAEHTARIGFSRTGRPRPDLSKRVWCIETGREYRSISEASQENHSSQKHISRSFKTGEAVKGKHFSLRRPTPERKTLALLKSMFPEIRKAITGSAQDAASVLGKIRGIIVAMLLACCAANASITYDVSIDTSHLPAGNYQAAFFLTDPAAPENFSRAKLPVSFGIDGDIIRDSTHYYADQPVIPFSVGYPWSWPLNFNLTLSGAQDSPDYFFMAIRTPDGGIFAAPDGNQWLLWAQMGAVDPVLNYDMPDMSFSVSQVPEPPLVMLAGIGVAILMRRRAA